VKTETPSHTEVGGVIVYIGNQIQYSAHCSDCTCGNESAHVQ